MNSVQRAYAEDGLANGIRPDHGAGRIEEILSSQTC